MIANIVLLAFASNKNLFREIRLTTGFPELSLIVGLNGSTRQVFSSERSEPCCFSL